MLVGKVVGVIVVACVLGVACGSGVQKNERTWTSYAYDPVSNNVVVAFSPWVAAYGASYGLESRMCEDVYNCDDVQVTYEAVKCLRGTDAQAIVEDLTVHLPGTTTFGGQYMLYTEYNPSIGGTSDEPDANTLMLYICQALGCAHSITQNYEYTIIDNGYWPSMGFVKVGLGGQVPAIAYVAIPKATNTGYLPSIDHVGQLTLTVCSKVDCDATTERYKTVLDECTNPKDTAGQPLCAGTSMTITNGFPQILYYGPGSKVSSGMQLKLVTCTDAQCQQRPTPVEIYQVSSDFGPFAGNAMITTRDAGYPAFVHIKPDGDLYLTRCQTYDCGSMKEDRISAGLLGQTQTMPYIAIGPDQMPIITYIRQVSVQGVTKHDLMIVYCLETTCATWSSPEVLTDCSGNACMPTNPTITTVGNSHIIVGYRDIVHNKDFMFVCLNTTCTPSEIENSLEIETTWGPGECNGLFPAAPAHKKKSNAGAVAAGIIISLIVLAGVSVFAYYMVVIRKGGKWPWEGISQPKGLDSYAEL